MTITAAQYVESLRLTKENLKTGSSNYWKLETGL